MSKDSQKLDKKSSGLQITPTWAVRASNQTSLMLTKTWKKMVEQIDGDDEDQHFPVLKSNTNTQANHADI